MNNALSATRIALHVLVGFLTSCFYSHRLSAFQLDGQLPSGLQRIATGKHLIIITDLPVDDEIRQLPDVFDQAIPRWCELFSIPPVKTSQWQVKMYLMLDRQRFRETGYLPKEIPEFQHGWQSGDQIWIQEQPSHYYRRHLMLHEGTHWFMQKKYGSYHAPWMMEGIAELLGTHRMRDGVLELGIVPRDKLEVPFWGRITLIKQQIQSGTAPSLEDVFLYSNSAHQRVDAYAWSWAMVLFLQNHPSTSKLFAALLKQPAMEASEMYLWLKDRLRGKFARVRSEWAAFIGELDYGYTHDPGMLQLSENCSGLDAEISFALDARRGWQSSGIQVNPNQRFEVRAAGEYLLTSEPKPWVSHPEGLTLEYYWDQPLGKLMMTCVSPLDSDLASLQVPQRIPVGENAVVSSETGGEVFFRINEANANLADNTGKVMIRIRPAD